MKTSDFYYNLPDELIAQTPAEPRDSSRLMVLSRDSDRIEHRRFSDIVEYLHPGDTLIVNDSRVIPARIYGTKDDTGAKIEFLLLRQIENNIWETLAKPGRKARIGASFTFGDGLLHAKVIDVTEDGNRIVEMTCSENIYTTLEKIGRMPLPPYITAELKDQERYQTVYSNELGSAAAPTAGLHFTSELLDRIEQMGVDIGYVTLHVGLGTFRPVKVDDVTLHKMHSEHYEVPLRTAELIRRTKERGGRVIAVGTTTCRTLESVAKEHGEVVADEGFTDIFIYPGFKFRVLDGLLTNFHLPQSTLIMLVSAFYGYDKTMSAYRTAVEERYRFFSFGDAMLIL